MLSAALTFGSVFSASAAPLAKKAAGVSKAECPVAAQAKAAKKLQGVSLTKALAAASNDGKFQKIQSKIKATNKRALRSATAASHAVAANVDLRGTLAWANAWQTSGTPTYGMFKVPTTTGGAFELLVPHEKAYLSGYDNGDGIYYGYNVTSVRGIFNMYSIDTVDAETGEVLNTYDDDQSFQASDIAVDPTTGDAYACLFDMSGDGFWWSKVDFSVPSRQDIGKLSVHLLGIGVTSSGQFYGVGGDGNFYKIDKSNGALEEIGDGVGVEMEYLTGGCVNNQNNTFLMAWNNDSSDPAGLLEIDLATGAVTVLAQFSDGEEVTGLYIAKPAAEDKAPAAPVLAVDCPDGAMDVNVKLTMPDKLFDGTPATGQTFSYKVIAGDQTVLEGSAAAGSEINQSVTLTVSGMTTFVATVSNSVGDSPKAKASCYVGKGTPAAPANVVLALNEDGAGTLSWDAVTTSSDGGYLNPADVTYTVLDSEGGVLNSDLKATQVAVSVNVPASYTLFSFSVRANYDGKSSADVESNKVGLGELAAPLTMDMTNPDNFGLHTVLDVNGDGKTWNYNESKGCTVYLYSTSSDADDWLFSPGIKLEGGKAYKIKVMAASNSANYPERIEVKAGTTPSVAGMTYDLIAPTVLSSKDPVELAGFIIVPTTGQYHLGFHAISDADQFYLYLHSYEISSPIDGTLPTAVTDVNIEPDMNGALKAAISFKAPVKDISGGTLAGSMKVKVTRNGQEVKTVDCQAGAAVSLEDTSVPEMGDYEYSFISMNANGEEGLSTSKTVYVGPKTPADIDTNTITLEQTAPGTFVLKWGAVTTAADGSPILPENIEYRVMTIVPNAMGSLSVGEVLGTTTDLEYTYVTEPAVDQDIFRLGVQAVNLGVGSEYIGLGSILVGEPYEMPVVYTGESTTYFTSSLGSVSLGSSKNGIPAQDGDDSFYMMKGAAIDGENSLQTGLISIDGDAPVVDFWVYSLSGAGEEGGEDLNQTKVSVLCDGQLTQIGSFAHNEEGMEGEAWNHKKFSLSQFKGKIVQVRITGVCKSYIYNIYDNIRIRLDLNYDLAAEISAPAKATTGSEFDVTVNVKNDGSEDADAYAVELYRDGKLVETKNMSALASDNTAAVTFKQTLGLYDGDAVEYMAKVVYEADENLENNETETVSVARVKNTFPVVTGLEGEKTEQGNSLTWDPVVIGEKVPTEVTEDFEEGESFAHEFADWTFVDVDQLIVGGFQGVDLPGITPGESMASFFVFDNSLPQFNPSYVTRSGSKFLATLFQYQDQQIDDWAISPLLTGDAQTISFFARSYSNEYPEKIEVWYTTSSSVDPADFVKVEAFGSQVVPGPISNEDRPFTEYSADLPAGAMRFAIRSCAAGSFMLMVDDVTYTKLDGFEGELKGYNVYRDGVKLNEAPVAEASFLDTEADDAAHTYHVTAVYDKGESELSEPVVIDQSGIDSILAGGVKVSVEGRDIVVAGAAGKLVVINSVDGKTLYSAQGDARVAVTSAVYLVTVDRKTVKVVVR